MKCINHYIGNKCNNDANYNNLIIDACGKPLFYCEKCFDEARRMR